MIPSLPEDPIEGYTSEQQRLQIFSLITEYAPRPKYILEIGFNAGHSADAFLRFNTRAELVSFDIGDHDYVKDAKNYIDYMYPERHTLIIGDSTETIPKYSSENKFDVIFIDGGHQFEVAKADLENCKRFAHKNTLVIVDDIVSRQEWTYCYNVGPIKAWKEAKNSGMIKELGAVEYSPGKGMTWGRYL